MERRRVLLLGMPPLLRDLVGEIVAQEDDLEIVGELEDGSVLAAASHFDADFVIVALGESWLYETYRLLEHRPRTKVLALSGDGRGAVLWELHPRLTPLGELSPPTVLAAIRSRDWRQVGAAG